MNTTNIFVELVVVGFHTLIWIGVLILAFVPGYRNLDLEKVLTVNLALPILAMAYILGILVDRITDSLFFAHDLKMRQIEHKQADLPSFLSMRYYILYKSNDIYAQLEYSRSRLRIARASVGLATSRPVLRAQATRDSISCPFDVTLLPSGR